MMRYLWTVIALLIGIVMAFAIVGQVLALATFVGWLPATYALGATSYSVLLGVICFMAFWIRQVRQDGFRHQPPQPAIRFTVAVQDHPVRAILGLYWVVTFIGLALLGGLDNRGVVILGHHYYLQHVHGLLTAISRAEYQRQAAYPLWMVTAWTLFSASLVLAPAMRRSLWIAGLVTE